MPGKLRLDSSVSEKIKSSLVILLKSHGRLSRDNLLDVTFYALDDAINDLCRDGIVRVERAEIDQSHLDVFSLKDTN